MKEVSLAEVRKHNSEENGVWIVIDELVYDVSKFKDHPGQFDILLLNAGADVSKQFHTIHDSSVYELRDKFLVGKLVRKEGEENDYAVPNRLVDTDTPWYYYILPLTVLMVILYFVFFFHE